GFGPGLGRYFVSEDFFVLRWLTASSLGEATWAHLTGPLLEISFVKFYRPVAAFLLHLETLFWGMQPTGYLVTHLAVHLLNVGLVHRLAGLWSGGSRAAAYGTALIFAVYPLHPNAVLFVAGFATLFSTTFLLVSLLLYEHYRKRREAWTLAGSLACFALALGCYEQVVILPGLIMGREWLADRFAEAAEGEPRRPWWRELWGSLFLALRPAVAFLAVLVLYFIVRQAALGQVVAGYEGFRQRWLAAEILRLGQGLVEGLAYLVVPDFTRQTSIFATVLVVSAVVVISGWATRRGGATALLWFFGLVWVVASQAPFSFARVAPGNGRYWYLTSIGLGLAFVAAARLLAPWIATRRTRWTQEAVVALLLGALGTAYWLGLIAYTRVYAEAGRITKTLQGRLLEVRGAPDERLFVIGQPDMVRNALGTTLAQVYHWGLSDALAPPFVEPGATVYPLPRGLTDAELRPILQRADLGPTWRWDPAADTLDRVAMPAGGTLRRLATRRLGPDSWQFQAAEGRHRLVLLTRGGASTHAVQETADAEGWIPVRPPAEVVHSMRHLYGGEVFCWIEERQQGRLVAASALLELG
ncbi:MAG: hypothetical protein AAF657_38670, partial [Acidobacteriota bacterium]